MRSFKQIDTNATNMDMLISGTSSIKFQEQDFFRILKQCQKDDFPFMDGTFAPEDKSLCDDKVEFKQFWSHYRWCRAPLIPRLIQ